MIIDLDNFVQLVQYSKNHKIMTLFSYRLLISYVFYIQTLIWSQQYEYIWILMRVNGEIWIHILRKNSILIILIVMGIQLRTIGRTWDLGYFLHLRLIPASEIDVVAEEVSIVLLLHLGLQKLQQVCKPLKGVCVSA